MLGAMFRLTTFKLINARHRLPFHSSSRRGTYLTAPKKAGYNIPILSETRTLKTGNQPFIPTDWELLDMSYGYDNTLTFFNEKTGEITDYTPKGMTAEELMQIPYASAYFDTKEVAEAYIEERAVKRQCDAEEGKLNPEVSVSVQE
jgi:hypothetical protein